ncbi:MAG: hypothetical protein R3Y15_00010 [Rikenellaceae bacterium]
MKTQSPYTDAEAHRNTLMLELYGLEGMIKAAKTTTDYVDLIRRTGMLAETMANVLTELAKTGESLKPIDKKTADWLKKM